VTRLADLGVEPFQITTTVLGVLAVRLMRKVCFTCRELTTYSTEELALLNLTPERVVGKKLYRARPNGCSSCKNLGYSGRMGIYELLVFEDAIRQQIVKSVDGAALRKIAVSKGMTSLRDSAAERFMNGETTLDEALQKTQVDD
jgi:type II secretory ATPase GspE/PulE/Tfp pilus assembly ATPase PilB-like protein